MEFWFLSFHVSNNSRCLGLTGGKVPSCSSRAVPFPSCLWMWCTLKLGVLKQFYTLGLACKVIQSCVFLFAFTRGRFRLWARVQEDDLIVNSQPSSLPHGDSHCAPAMPLSDKHWKIVNQRWELWASENSHSQKVAKKRQQFVLRQKSKHQAGINHLIHLQLEQEIMGFLKLNL